MRGRSSAGERRNSWYTARAHKGDDDDKRSKLRWLVLFLLFVLFLRRTASDQGSPPLQTIEGGNPFQSNRCHERTTSTMGQDEARAQNILPRKKRKGF